VEIWEWITLKLSELGMRNFQKMSITTKLMAFLENTSQEFSVGRGLWGMSSILII
jgi:hypothetical protein